MWIVEYMNSIISVVRRLTGNSVLDMKTADASITQLN